MKPLILVDFDGTIVRQDATDLILERFALPEWRDVEQDWVSGRIGSRECLARQVDLVRASPEELDRLIDGLEIDPAFSTFSKLCQDLGFSVVVGSDGLDRVIAATLGRAGIEIPFMSNRLVQTGADRWRVEFPHFRSACEVASGTCKCAIANPATGITVMVGDGRSDFCAAGQAKWVLAKGALARHCRQSGIPHTPIEGFADPVDAIRTLSRLIPTSSASPHPQDAVAGAPHA
jgi:2-hydroxy-3-keto-5-methylthiopentenyl-1-phosphate phosphatase